MKWNFLSRSPLLLYSYLATEMLAPFFASFLVMNGVFVLVELIPFLNFALDLRIGLADFVRLFSYMMPNMLLYTVPMASMMGVIICFSRLSTDSEILALKASGVSIYRLLPPVCAVAGAIALITAYISITLISRSDLAMKQLTYQLLKEKVDKGIKEYQFTEALGDLVIHVDKIDHETGEWKNVWVSDMRGQVNPSITMASTGHMVSDMKQMNVTVRLHNGSMHRPDGQNAQIVQFVEYIINIPLQLPAQARIKQRSTLTLLQLHAAARERGLDTEQGREMLVQFHKRLVLPGGCLILSILGLPLGLLAGPGKKTVGIPIGLGIFIIYYVIFTTVKTLAEDGIAPVLPLMWLPNMVFAVAAVYSVRRVAHELPLLPEMLQAFLIRLYRLTLHPPATMLGRLLSSLGRLLFRGFRRTSAVVTEEDQSPPIMADTVHKVFHLPGCVACEEGTCTTKFENVEDAINSGYQPGDCCRALVEKSPQAKEAS